MLDIGWTELLIVGVVALIVVGPKDLPGMFRTLGRFTGRLRGMAREFQRAMDDAARDTGVKDMADDLKKATSPRAMGLDTLNAAADRFEKWDPIKGNAKTKPPGATAGPATSALAEERKTKAQDVKVATASRAAKSKSEPAAPVETPDNAAAGTDPAPAPKDPAP
jgi:sec-independent protein translocase protein TatB